MNFVGMYSVGGYQTGVETAATSLIDINCPGILMNDPELQEKESYFEIMINYYIVSVYKTVFTY